MIQITLKEGGSPLGTEVIKNVTSVNGTALTGNAPGNVADQTTAVTAVGTATLFRITYTDDNGSNQNRVISVSDLKGFV